MKTTKIDHWFNEIKTCIILNVEKKKMQFIYILGPITIAGGAT